jgi:cyclophilin family peptidyl-prolyl cis-trans isomerase
VSKKAKRERQRLNREARREAEQASARRRKQMRAGRNIAILAVPLVALFIIFQVRNSGGSEPTHHLTKPPAPAFKPDTTYTATIETSDGTMVVSLDTTAAPNSANNFAYLAKHKFYDGLTFHRVAKDFVIQGGDPQGNGRGGPGYTIPVETPANGYQVGSVAWAKTGSAPAGTAGSQFFVVSGAGQGLDTLNQPPYQYGIVGTVTQGLDVVQRISALAPASGNGKPTKKVTIKKVTIAEAPSSTAGSVPPGS